MGVFVCVVAKRKKGHEVVKKGFDGVAGKGENKVDNQVKKRVSEALSYGVSRIQEREVRDGEIKITCHIPRLSHALRVTAGRVPAAGKWQKADLKGDEPFEARLKELQALDRPVMVVAKVKDRGAPHDYFQSWVRPNNKAIRRISYTLEEVVALQPHATFEDYSVIVGPDWRQSVTGKMMGALERVAGGRRVAAVSWSANVAAENILCGGFRRLRGTENLPPECVWLSAQDRLLMIRPVQALLDCGATLVSAYAGNITVKMPADPELLTSFVQTAWAAGLHLPIEMVRKMQELGVEVPFDPQSFGGAPEDVILGQLQHRGQRNAMWRLDEILETPARERADAFAAIFG